MGAPGEALSLHVNRAGTAVPRPGDRFDFALAENHGTGFAAGVT